jgi:hypothetical protein
LHGSISIIRIRDKIIARGGVFMGRGSEGQTVAATNQQLATQNAMNQQLNTQNQSLYSQLLPGYQNLLNNPGYTPAQQAAITGQAMGALGSTFGSLMSNAANNAARTNNDAGYNSALDALSRNYGTSAASVAQQAQIAFANKQQSDQLAALQGLAGLYGTNSNLLGHAIGIPSDLLGVQQRAAAPSTSFNLGIGPNGLSAGVGGAI